MTLPRTNVRIVARDDSLTIVNRLLALAALLCLAAARRAPSSANTGFPALRVAGRVGRARDRRVPGRRVADPVDRPELDDVRARVSELDARPAERRAPGRAAVRRVVVLVGREARHRVGQSGPADRDPARGGRNDPPLTVGRLGAVRSSFTVLLEPAVVGSHDDTLPALSTERNCTMVVPSAVKNYECRKARVRYESGDQVRGFAPCGRLLSELYVAVRAHAVVCVNESPAIRAHAAFIHQLILQARSSVSPLVKFRLPHVV